MKARVRANESTHWSCNPKKESTSLKLATKLVLTMRVAGSKKEKVDMPRKMPNALDQNEVLKSD